MTEKAAKEWTREAGDKKIALMKRVREANKRRAQRIKGRKEKQLKVEREGKKERKRKVQRGMQDLKEIQKYQNGADLLIRRLPFQWLVRELHSRRERG